MRLIIFLKEENIVDLPEQLREELGLDEEEKISISTTEYTDVAINEFFVDTNWDNKVYFRTGKQILKWGRSYFWNPTDLINVERKDFLDLDKIREGSYGTKVHVPFGAEKNLYVFLGMNEVEELEQISTAVKYEFLVANTEMSVSAWNKKEQEPVCGFDISSRIADVDVRGEISLAAGANNSDLDYNSLDLVTKNDTVTQVSVGFTKYFDYGDFKDRITLTGETYYNSNGYDKNIFQRLETAGTRENKINFLTDVYQPYTNSKYYLAFFSTIDRFITADTSLNVDSIINLVDDSSVVNAGINYDPLTDIVIGLDLTTRLGDNNTEATFSGDKLSISLTTEISF